MIIIPIPIVIMAFILLVPTGRFIILEKLGLTNEAKPIIKTMMPTIKAGILAIRMPPRLNQFN